MKPRPKLVASSEAEERTRVCGIVFRRHDEHEFRALQAWRAREHPRWSQHFSDFRVVSRPRLRKVLG